MKVPLCSANTAPCMEGLTLRKDDREAGGVPGLAASAGWTSTCNHAQTGTLTNTLTDRCTHTVQTPCLEEVQVQLVRKQS